MMNNQTQPIRNLSAFMASYTNSESFKRSVNRQAPTVEVTEENAKGQPVKYRKTLPVCNSLALAFADAFKK